MNSATPDPLIQLEGFLQHDPGNNGLRVAAFEEAQRQGRYDRAAAHLDAALAGGAEPLAWSLRRAHWLMATQQWSDAASWLEGLVEAARAEALPELESAANIDLAMIALRLGRASEGLQRLQPLVSAGNAAPSPVVQALWLRLRHHAGQLPECIADARRWADAAALCPEAAGVASLAALDASELALCDGWSRQALQHHPAQLEALVSQGSLALARTNAEDAKGWIQRALDMRPDDGRALSAMGFAQLLETDAATAARTFEHALVAMPGHIGTWHGLGWARLFTGDLAGARAAFDEALGRDRNFAESHGAVAVILAREGRRDAAEKAVDIALRLDRDCMSAHYARAILDGQADNAAALSQLAAALLQRRTGRVPR